LGLSQFGLLGMFRVLSIRSFWQYFSLINRCHSNARINNRFALRLAGISE